MQEINILGTALTDYSLKESLVLVDDYVKNGALNTILYITTPMLIMAGKEEMERKRIESMDLTLCGDGDILRVAKIGSLSRLHEVENYAFLKEFLRRVARSSGKVYLLTGSEEETETLARELGAFQKGILISGSSVIAEDAEEIEEIINRINDVAPMAVISRMAPGRQERWMAESRPFVNAEVWLGIAKDMVLDGTRETIGRKVKGKIYKKIFHRWMNRFQNENEKSRGADLK